MSVFAPELITLNLVARDKHDAIAQLAQLVVNSGRGNDSVQIATDVLARDAMGTPQVDGIAIPHARTSGVQQSCVAIARSSGVLFDESEGPADVVIMILVPDEAGDEHIQILSKVARNLMKPEFRSALRSIQDCDGVVKLVEGGAA